MSYAATAARAKKLLVKKGAPATISRTGDDGTVTTLSTYAVIVGRPRFMTDTPLGDYELIMAHDVQPLSGDIVSVGGLALILRVHPVALEPGGVTVIYTAWGFEK